MIPLHVTRATEIGGSAGGLSCAVGTMMLIASAFDGGATLIIGGAIMMLSCG